jgi:hypothetical protein
LWSVSCSLTHGDNHILNCGDSLQITVIMAERYFMFRPAESIHLNALNRGADVVNSLDCDTLVEAMHDPAGNRGVVEDVLMRALSRDESKIKPIP